MEYSIQESYENAATLPEVIAVSLILRLTESLAPIYNAGVGPLVTYESVTVVRHTGNFAMSLEAPR